jgi:hypothetical protein
MKLSGRSIQALAKIITGDEGISPYRSGSKLVHLFNEFGANDHYGKGFPSRWQYAEDKRRAMNGTKALPALIRSVFDPRDSLDAEKEIQPAIDYTKSLPMVLAAKWRQATMIRAPAWMACREVRSHDEQ